MGRTASGSAGLNKGWQQFKVSTIYFFLLKNKSINNVFFFVIPRKQIQIVDEMFINCLIASLVVNCNFLKFTLISKQLKIYF